MTLPPTRISELGALKGGGGEKGAILFGVFSSLSLGGHPVSKMPGDRVDRFRHVCIEMQFLHAI